MIEIPTYFNEGLMAAYIRNAIYSIPPLAIVLLFISFVARGRRK